MTARIGRAGVLLAVLMTLPAPAVLAQSNPPAASAQAAPAPAAGAASSAGAPAADTDAVTAPAVNPSVMFSASDYAAIVKAIEDFRSGVPAAAALPEVASTPTATTGGSDAKKAPLPNIRVSGIMDFGGGDWTVWINGKRLTPASKSTDFTIKSVDGDSVQLVMTGGNSAPITLHSHQTWIASQNSVVEGIVP